MSNKYSNIPSFELFDTCRIELDWVRDEQKEIIKHTIITYSLSETGVLIKDEHLLEKLTPTGFNRSLHEVDNYKEYLNIHNENVSGWYYQKCRDEFLGKRNIAAYESLKKTAADYRKRFEDIKDSEFAQNVLQYFIQVQLEFESWFWQNDMEVNQNKTNESVANPVTVSNDTDANKKGKYKKNIPKEVKLFLKVVQETESAIPTLVKLKEKTGISISTWSRRIIDKNFLLQLTELITKEKNKIPPDSALTNLYDETLEEVTIKLNKKVKRKSRDIYDKSKRYNNKPIDDFSSTNSEESNKMDKSDKEYNLSGLLNFNKIILN